MFMLISLVFYHDIFNSQRKRRCSQITTEKIKIKEKGNSGIEVDTLQSKSR
jgi:hypothetical protein